MRYFARYDVDQHENFKIFLHWLQSVEGGQRSERAAREIAIDVAKFLKMWSGDEDDPNWYTLLVKEYVTTFLEKLGVSGCGPEGQLTKLDNLQTALRFVRMHILDDDAQENSESFYRAMKMEDTIRGYKKTLRKSKQKRVEERLEHFSETPMSLSEVTAVVENESLWADFDNIIERAQKMENVSSAELNRCTLSVAALLLYKNWQRPGAVCNCTMEDLKNARVLLGEGEEGLFQISVKEHKTSIKGPARLMLSPRDRPKLTKVEVVRSLLDPNGTCNRMLVLSGPKPIQNLHSQVKGLCRRHGFVVPSSARVRKIGSTVTVLQCDHNDAQLIQRQMSHTPQTQVKHYEAIVGPTHAAAAFRKMEILRSESGEMQADVAVETPANDSIKPVPVEKPTDHSAEKHSPHKRRKRTPYTQEEEQQIRAYFAEEIVGGRTPTIDACQEFLRDHEIDRDKYQIQNKVKNINKFSN